MPDQDNTLHPGDTLRNLRLIEKVAEGRWCDVWKAHDQGLDLQVAVKVLREAASRSPADPEIKERFLREVRSAITLRHDNLMRLFNYGCYFLERTQKSYHLAISQWVEGQAYSSWSGYSWPSRIRFAYQAFSALTAIHANGVSHGGICPQALLVNADKLTLIGLELMGQNRDIAAQTWSAAEENLNPSPESDVHALGKVLLGLCFDRREVHPSSSKDAELADSAREFLESCLTLEAGDRPTAETVSRGLAGLVFRQEDTGRDVVLPSIESRIEGLPRRFRSFVGREKVLEELENMLVGEGVSILSVIGAGGIGKTQTAIALAERLKKRVGGVEGAFIDLSESRSLAGALSTIALGARLSAVRGELIDHLRDTLAARGPYLLILDNLEHLVDELADTISMLHSAATNLTIVITSREALNIAGERVYRLEPLDADNYAAAVQLFVDRAKSARESFQLFDEERPLLLKLMRDLDGIPLAIELAAARVASMSLPMLIERMGTRFQLLTSRRRDVSDRQRTLYSTLEWSWELLNDYEQEALSQCAIFDGGFTLEAAEAVLDLEAYTDAPLKIDVIQDLVAKSLVTTDQPEHLSGEVTYRLFESIRYFADSKRRPEGDDALRLRHANYYCDRMEALSKRIDTPAHRESMGWFALEFRNALAVQEHFQDRPDRAELAARALLGVFPYLATAIPAQQTEVRAQQLIAQAEHLSETTMVRLLTMLGRSEFTQGKYKDALAHLEEADRLAESQAVSPEATFAAFNGHGVALFWTGQTDAAIECYAKAKEVAEASNNQRGLIALGVNHLLILEREGRGEELIAQAQGLIEECVAAGNGNGLAKTYSNIGAQHFLAGRLKPALRFFERAIRVHLDLGDHIDAAFTMINAAQVYSEFGNYQRADECYAFVRNAARREGNRDVLMRARGARGDSLLRRESYQEAKQEYRVAIEEARAIGDEWTLAYWLIGLSHSILEGQGDEATDEDLLAVFKHATEGRSLRHKHFPVHHLTFAALTFEAKVCADLARRSLGPGLQAAQTLANQAREMAKEGGFAPSEALGDRDAWERLSYVESLDL